MTYKGYRILANSRTTLFFETNAAGEAVKPVQGINYEQGDDSELWYSVIDADDWVVQSFESVEECKQVIREMQ